MEMLIEQGKLLSEVVESKRDDGSHVQELKGFALVCLFGVGLEDIVGEVVEEILGGDQDVCRTVHPH